MRRLASRGILLIAGMPLLLGLLPVPTALGAEGAGKSGTSPPAQSEHQKVSGQDVAELRQSERAKRQQGEEPAELRERREEHVETMAGLGRSIALDRIDAIPVDKDVTVVVPESLEVGEVELIPGPEGQVEVAMETTAKVGEEPAADGMGSYHNAHWLSGPSNCGTMHYAGRGKLLTCYYKNQLGNDGYTAHDVWLYRRKGAYQDYEVSGYNWSGTDIRIHSYPTSASSWKFMSWLDFDPDSDVNGSCNNRNAQVNTPIGGLGISFVDCDTHDITWGSAGDFESHYKQGAIFSRGNRSTAFEIAVKIEPGQTPYWTDYSSFRTARYTYPGDWCSGYGTGDHNC